MSEAPASPLRSVMPRITPVGVHSAAHPVPADKRVPFELLLFTVNPELVRRGADAGIDGFVVDWEFRGKERRQRGADTQINSDTVEDLARVRAATAARVLVRLNGFGETTAEEMERAVERGADEILLPMVTRVDEVERTLEMAHGRVGVGILIETTAGVALAERLCALPLSRVYVGLNDLAIERGTRSIFEAVADGTVERLRQHAGGRFGFGGVTLPECGSPVPCNLLMGELRRIGATFSFLRRSFLRDTHGKDWRECVGRIRHGLAAAACREVADVAADRAVFAGAVAAAGS